MPTKTESTTTQAAGSPVPGTLTIPFDERAVDSALLFHLRRLEEMAFRDYLTQLPNRCAIDFTLSQHLAAFQRYEIPFSVLLADLDDFKRINDRYGHPVGDRVLRATAQSLRNCIREADFVGRWGGEEFMVIAAHTDGSGLPSLAERIRKHIAAAQIRVDRSIVPITASIGATVCQENDTLHSLIERVDSLLYESKASGKNRITLQVGRIILPES